jgi:retron-type reverse transcriptase
VINNKQNHYGSFTIPKWDGSPRLITPPKEPIKSWQHALKSFLTRKFTPAAAIHGGVRGRSTTTNARLHTGKKLVLNLDIQKFFPKTTEERIRNTLRELHASNTVATAMTEVLTFKNELPQGSPASVVMCNLVLRRLDQKIERICAQHKFSYTRYIDDITISGADHLANYRDMIRDSILDFGYQISENKLTPVSGCQVVTGLVVNENLRPTNEFLDSLIETLKACVNGHLQEICTADDTTPQQLITSLRGQISHARQFQPEKAKKLSAWLKRLRYEIMPALEKNRAT